MKLKAACIQCNLSLGKWHCCHRLLALSFLRFTFLGTLSMRLRRFACVKIAWVTLAIQGTGTP